MKILIVDDEALVRVGMRVIVPWQQYGYEVVGEAANGIEAITISRLSKPDIILVDIVMPEMNGIEFIEYIKKELPECKFIILSCRNDLHFYKQAIQLGVSDYIEKSEITPEQILQVVNRVSNELRKKRVFDSHEDIEKTQIDSNLVLVEFLNQVLKGKIKDENQISGKLESYGLSMRDCEYYVLAIAIENTDNKGEESDGSIDYPIVNMCQGIINDTTKGYIFKNYNDIITAIIVSDGSDCSQMFVENIFYRMHNSVEQCLDVVLTAGSSYKLNNCHDIFKGYSQATNSLGRKYFEGSGGVIFSNSSYQDEEIINNIEKQKNLALSIQSPFESESIINIIESITKNMASSHVPTFQYAIGIYAEVLFHIIGLLYKQKIDIKEVIDMDFNPIKYLESTKNILQLHDRMINIINQIKWYYVTKINKNKVNVISSIEKYILENIDKKITLEGISKAVYMSPAYVCRLFKKETGGNIQDFILKSKVEKSKEMLCLNYEISEIAEATGFSTINYFIKVFKSYTKLTPKQYIKRMNYL